MAKKNSFLEEQRLLRIKFMEVATDTTEQQMFDYLCIVLNDPEIMGKNVFGAKRLRKIHDALKAVNEQFGDAWTTSPEADYQQEKLDARLREIFGDECPPFRARYPYMKEFSYKKPYKPK